MSGTYDFMRTQDVAVFRAAAKHFDLWILVRRTNPAALPYIGLNGYVPKPLDCKAKTADRNVIVPDQTAAKKTAGLVVDPTLPGFETAFDKSGKAHSAAAEWANFKKLVYAPAPGAATRVYLPMQQPYYVQRDIDHRHYGCVMLTRSLLATAGTCIHGDYDLYAIVPNANRAENVFVNEKRFGDVPHARGPEFLDVQMYLNRGIGSPMVRHGDQEKYAGHSDEDIDVFHPDGVTITELLGRESIQWFYDEVFGRKPAAKGAAAQPHTGLWKKI